MSVKNLLRCLGLKSWDPTDDVRSEAESENAIRDNDKASAEVQAASKQSAHIATTKLREAVERVRTPFTDLEDLTLLRNTREKLRK